MIIYTASKVFRAPMWQDLRRLFPALVFNSRWIDIKELEQPGQELDPRAYRNAWINNIEDVASADRLIAYAEAGDPLNGTLVEIGAMLAANYIETGGYPVQKSVVYLVGDYDWKTWKHHPRVHIHPPTTETAAQQCVDVLFAIQRKEI